MCSYSQSCTLPVLMVGIVSLLALSSGSDAFESGRLLENSVQSSSHGAQFKLLHWSHPEAPHFVTGLNFGEKFKQAVQSGYARVAAFSGNAQQSSQDFSPASAPAPSGNFYSPLVYESFVYAIQITLGTPPQNFSVIADTGSDLVWVKSTACVAVDYCAPQSDPLYNPASSSTYVGMSCVDPQCLTLAPHFCDNNNSTCFYVYISETVDNHGHLAYETLTLTTTGGQPKTADHFTFGAANLTFPSNLGGLDGVVGLGQGPLSFTSQLGSLFDNKFSYCLVNYFDSSKTASLLLFGDAAVPKGPIRYTPMVQNPNATYPGAATFYYIGLKGIKVGGKSLNIPAGAFDIAADGSGGVILDSGTTYTYLAGGAYAPLFAELVAQTKYPRNHNGSRFGIDLCYDLTNVTDPIFPVVTMELDGFDLDLPWQNVFLGGELYSWMGNNVTYCLVAQNSYFTSFSVFGNVALQNFQILHDQKNRLFGFSQVECDKLKL